MDHVLIDMSTHCMLGRGSHEECTTARERLTGNEHIVFCGEAKGFAVYEHEQLNTLWRTAKGWEYTPLVDYPTMCRAMKKEADLVGPISVYLSTLGANEMSQQPERNGVKWPQRGASARVFEIAQQISTQKQNFATKEEVVAAASAERINEGTAATQYSAWRRYWAQPNELKNHPMPAAAPEPQAAVAPAAPPQPAPSVPQQVQEVVQQAAAHAPQAPTAFAPPIPPQFAAAPAQSHAAPAAPTAPAQFAPQTAMPAQASAPFQQPAHAEPNPLKAADVPEAAQQTRVLVGMHVGVDLSPAITRLERLLALLRDAQADFGD